MAEQTGKQCAATTKKGTRCRNFALANSEFCRHHQPQPAADAPSDAPPADDYETLRAQLIAELDALAERVSAVTPNYTPPPFSIRGAMRLASKTMRTLTARRPRMLARLQNTFGSDLLDVDTWKGVWYMLNYTLEYQRDFLKRRITGEYETDEWGMDWEFAQALQPFMDFLYKIYWRVETLAVENIPEDGRVLLVGDAAGQYPWIGAMVTTAVATEHPDMRQVRSLYRQKFTNIPFFSVTFDKMGQAPANMDNGSRLLAQDEMVAVYPDDSAETGISWMQAAQMAVNTTAPIVPVAIIGVEGSDAAAKLAQTSSAPEAFAPWMSVLGNVPLPTPWKVVFGAPISVDGLASDTAQTLALVTTVKSALAELRKTHIPHLVA